MNVNSKREFWPWWNFQFCHKCFFLQSLWQLSRTCERESCQIIRFLWIIGKKMHLMPATYQISSYQTVQIVLLPFSPNVNHGEISLEQSSHKCICTLQLCTISLTSVEYMCESGAESLSEQKMLSFRESPKCGWMGWSKPKLLVKYINLNFFKS